ncbi:regulatory protein RecX [Flavobacterium sp. JP2137]|uniref:regulatory protein RecX n=1 Tax=Flavobacterium sp. JP2137 TaxID=3414510 RepID=UPI003D3011DB
MKQTSDLFITTAEAKRKLEYYCSYQERCHTEVIAKLRKLGITDLQVDEIVVHLIHENFLNEERFATSFARGKHRMSSWGKNRIVSELKVRSISAYNIKKALEELPDELYLDTFEKISILKWNSTQDKNPANKKKKVMDFLYRKGYESDLILEKTAELQREKNR